MVSKREASRQRTARDQAAEAAERSGGRQRRRRKRTIAIMAAVVSLAMILPLAAGIVAIATGGSSNDIETAIPVPTTTITIPLFVEPGRTISGAVPCPATDGTELRATTFSAPPPLCIDPQSDYLVTLSTDKGDAVLTIDPTLDAEAANLFVVLARYGYFDGLPIYTSSVGGPAISGDAGGLDPGFSVPATPIATTPGADASSPSESPYQIGSVVMAADANQRLDTRFAVIMNQEVVDTLTANPVNPVIGQVTSGLDVITSIVDDPAAVLGDLANLDFWLTNSIRIGSATVEVAATS